MKKEILISKSNFKIVELDQKIVGVNTIFTIESRPLYGLIVNMGSKSSGFSIIQGKTARNHKTSENMVYWKLEKMARVCPVQVYTKEDFSIILMFIKALYRTKRIGTCELFCRATKNLGVLNIFYGERSVPKEKRYFMDTADLFEIKEDAFIEDIKFPPEYSGRSRYSVYHLFKDLMNCGASIYIGKELIGKYNRISRQGVVPVESTKFDLEDWYPINRLVGNLERANLSILINPTVTVSIPKNEFGIEPGCVKLIGDKTINIINDLRINTGLIGIRLGDNNRLATKLRKMGCVEFDHLVFKNDILVDLGKLPAIRKNDLREISGFDLANSYVRYKFANAACKFYKFLIGEPEKSEKDKFLESLGIIGDHYSPRGIVPKPTESYDTKVIKVHVHGEDLDPDTKTIRSIIEGTCKGTGKIINFLKGLNKAVNPEEEFSRWKKVAEDQGLRYRLLVFELLASKDPAIKVRGERQILFDRKHSHTKARSKENILISWNTEQKTIIK